MSTLRLISILRCSLLVNKQCRMLSSLSRMPLPFLTSYSNIVERSQRISFLTIRYSQRRDEIDLTSTKELGEEDDDDDDDDEKDNETDRVISFLPFLFVLRKLIDSFLVFKTLILLSRMKNKQ